MSPSAPQQGPRNLGAYWFLRVLETGLLVSGLAGLGLFAWCIVDIVRIESAATPSSAMPPTAWPGVFLFFGSMVLLQVVRAFLMRYRRDDGTPRGDARSAAADVTAEVLASLDETAPAAAAVEVQTEG